MKHFKVDKYLLDKVRKCKDFRVTVIMYINGKIDNEFKKTISKLSGHIKYDLPLIHAVTVDIPCSSLETIAALPQIKYIQHDAVVDVQV